MFANAVLITIIATFVVVVLLGHILLIAAIWRDWSAASKLHIDTKNTGARAVDPGRKAEPVLEQPDRAKAA
jgi:hypothetical protein